MGRAACPPIEAVLGRGEILANGRYSRSSTAYILFRTSSGQACPIIYRAIHVPLPAEQQVHNNIVIIIIIIIIIILNYINNKIKHSHARHQSYTIRFTLNRGEIRKILKKSGYMKLKKQIKRKQILINRLRFSG